MIVKAKCTAPAWDSPSAVLYAPGGGPLEGGLYEIDTEGPLPALKIGNRYVFEFDRNANPDDKPHDYSCKEEGCGAFFKTLNELGTHTRKTHDKSPVVDNEPVVVVKDGRGKAKKGSIKCKECGEVVPHLYALKVHKKEKHAKVEAEPVLA